MQSRDTLIILKLAQDTYHAKLCALHLDNGIPVLRIRYPRMRATPFLPPGPVDESVCGSDQQRMETDVANLRATICGAYHDTSVYGRLGEILGGVRFP